MYYNTTIILITIIVIIIIINKFSSPLVPVFSFGETDVYDQLYGSQGSLFRRLQNHIRKIIGLAPLIFSGRGFFQYSFGLIPNRAPVTVVGKVLHIFSVKHALMSLMLDTSLFSFYKN